MNMDSEDDLKHLLTSLKGEALLDIFKEHNINTIALKYMTPSHLDIIVPKTLFGARIIFEHNLKTWQNELSSSLNIYKQSAKTSLLYQEEFCIEAVLKSSLSGKLILNYYDKNKKLITKYRKMIASCVVAFIIENKINPCPKYFENIAENIATYFTKENKDLYFIRKKGRKPGGCLYSKYHNSISNLRKEGLNENVYENKENVEDETQEDTDCLSDKEWLMNNIEPLPDVFRKWDNTFHIRRLFLKSSEHDLQHIFSEWPSYKQSFGHNLILSDFSKLYPGKEHLLGTKWDTFCSKMLKLIKRDVRDKYALDILEKFEESECSSDIRDCVVLDLMHSVLKPISRKCTVIDKNRRKYKKTSVEDSKKSFLVYASNSSELNTKIKLLVDECFANKQTLQPFICAIGASVFDFHEFFVYFGGIFYKLKDIKLCVDLTFKIFHSINIKYPQNCNLIWLFIQEYFFEIEVENYEKCTALSTILTDIETV